LQNQVERISKSLQAMKFLDRFRWWHCRLLESGHNIRVVQELMGHKDAETTLIYTHVMNNSLAAVRSPADTWSGAIRGSTTRSNVSRRRERTTSSPTSEKSSSLRPVLPGCLGSAKALAQTTGISKVAKSKKIPGWGLPETNPRSPLQATQAVQVLDQRRCRSIARADALASFSEMKLGNH